MTTTIQAPTTWAELQALEPTTEFRKEARQVETTWVLSSRETEKRGRPAVERVLVTLTTRHYGKTDLWGHPEKQYRSSLGYVKETRDGITVCMEFGVYNQKGVTVAQEADVARYSAKGLQAQHTLALATLEGVYDLSPNCQEVFAEALERHAGGGEQ